MKKAIVNAANFAAAAMVVTVALILGGGIYLGQALGLTDPPRPRYPRDEEDAHA